MIYQHIDDISPALKYIQQLLLQKESLYNAKTTV